MVDIKFIEWGNARAPKYSQVFEADDTEKEITIESPPQENIRLQKIILDIPDWTNTVSLSLVLKGPNDETLFSRSGILQNQEIPVSGINQVISKTCKIVLILSGVPGESGGTIDLYCYAYNQNFVNRSIIKDVSSINVPANTSSPAKIDCSRGDKIFLHALSSGLPAPPLHWCLAKSQAEANTKIASAATRGKFGNIFVYEINISKNDLDIYVRSSQGSLISEGIAYWIEENTG
jgi:hypothetical protein